MSKTTETKGNAITEEDLTYLQRNLGFKGDIILDPVSLNAFNSDASIYEITPSVVVYPKDEEDVIKIVKFAYQRGIPLHPRGASTGLAGQSVGSGIVLNFAKYMNKIGEVNLSDNTVWVQPGVVYGELNRFLSALNKIFPPDPASGDSCTIGGMIGNNSSGSHAVKYGATVDNVEELEVVLWDGSVIHTKPLKLNSGELKELLKADTLEGKLYRTVYDAVVKKKIPDAADMDVEKNCSGYCLNKIVDHDVFNLSRLFIGSEGTLGVVIKAKLKIIDIPKEKGVILLYFDSLEKAGKAVTILREYNPASIEIFDKIYIDLIKERYPIYRKKFPAHIEAMLLTEFDGDNVENVKTLISEAVKRVSNVEKLPFYVKFSFSKEEQEELWDIRRVAVPILNLPKGEKKVTPFIEDAAVHYSKLPEYIRFLRKLFKKYNVKSVIYGHASQGNVHTRPFLDLKKPEELKKLQMIAQEVSKKIKELKGTMSGEHGDGRIRTRFLAFQYGPVFSLFLKIKKLLDPSNLFNPGVKTDLSEEFMIGNLRYGSDYKVNPELLTSLKLFTEREFVEEIEKCHGCGKCTNVLTTMTMCPVFKISRDERDSPRGKANIFRALLKGKLDVETIKTTQFREILYSCIVCGACLKECASKVNIPKLVLEFKTRYVEYNGALDGFSELEEIDNKEMEPITCDLPESFFTFEDKELISLFEGEFTNYYDLNVLYEIKLILRMLGYKIIVPQHHPSGSVSLRLGNFNRVKKNVKENVKAYRELENIPIVTLTPQTTYILKYVYPVFLKNRKSVLEFSERVVYVNNLILDKIFKKEIKFKNADPKIQYVFLKSPFCRRAMISHYNEVELLNRIPNLNYTVLENDYYVDEIRRINYSFDFNGFLTSKIKKETSKIEKPVFVTSSQETHSFVKNTLSTESLHLLQIVKRHFV